MKFTSINTPEEFINFDKYLSTRTYIHGFKSTSSDLSVFVTLDKAKIKGHVNVQRWYNHIAALLSENFPGSINSVQNVFSVATPQVNLTDSKAKEKPKGASDDSDLDLFGSDSEDEESKEALKAIIKKKSDKKKVISLSAVVFDIKPYCDDYDITVAQQKIIAIAKENMTVKNCEVIKLAYGIKGLRIDTVITEDVDTELFMERVVKIDPDNIQSVDIKSFNKV